MALREGQARGAGASVCPRRRVGSRHAPRRRRRPRPQEEVQEELKRSDRTRRRGVVSFGRGVDGGTHLGTGIGLRRRGRPTRATAGGFLRTKRGEDDAVCGAKRPLIIPRCGF